VPEAELETSSDKRSSALAAGSTPGSSDVRSDGEVGGRDRDGGAGSPPPTPQAHASGVSGAAAAAAAAASAAATASASAAATASASAATPESPRHLLPLGFDSAQATATAMLSGLRRVAVCLGRPQRQHTKDGGAFGAHLFALVHPTLSAATGGEGDNVDAIDSSGAGVGAGVGAGAGAGAELDRHQDECWGLLSVVLDEHRPFSGQLELWLATSLVDVQAQDSMSTGTPLSGTIRVCGSWRCRCVLVLLCCWVGVCAHPANCRGVARTSR